MDKRKRNREEAHPLRNEITRELSPDIVFFHILPRLPVKSVQRFRCVCKQWYAFLTTDAFIKMHRRQITTKKMVVLSPTAPITYRTIDCERPTEGFSVARPFPFEVGRRQCVRILTSVHGLVCIGITPMIKPGYDDGRVKYYSDLILWNPATGDHKILSKPKLADKDCYTIGESLFGLYRSSWDDDYKLLRVTRHANVYIYSLKSDTWRKVESDLLRPWVGTSVTLSWVGSIWLDNNMYFLEKRNNSYSIMRFNPKAETLELIATPFLGNQRTTWLSFTGGRECIHLLVNINKAYSSCCENELWRLEADGNWSKVVNYPCPILDDTIHRLHVMRNGNMLIICRICRGGWVYELDMRTHTSVLRCSYTNQQMPRVWPGGKYIETLVSPNRP